MIQTISVNNQELTLEVGKYAQQATAAVLARIGETVVHATVVVGPENPAMNYLPLFVEYQEKLYAGGKIKGSRWVKREGRPSDEAILTSRLIDRSVRPMFPKTLRREIQIIITTLSVDGNNDPDIPAIIAASAALSLSGLPFSGPVGVVRVGYIPQNGSGSFVSNPTHQDRQYSDLDLVVSGTKDGIVMVEAGSNQITELTTVEALKYGQGEIEKIIDGISQLVKKAGANTPIAKPQEHKEAIELSRKLAKSSRKEIDDEIAIMATKESGSGSHLSALIDAISEKEVIEDKAIVAEALDKAITAAIRDAILTKGVRPDGRKSTEIRPITCRVGELPRTHGSAMFQRGSTQALTIVTLAPPDMEQWIESPESEETKRYIHHYNMPPFSVGETGRTGWPSRREIGHGALAERALLPVIPNEKEFPYTIRVVSEIMSSNGSTSMASVCGSTLSLMDAGVQIKAPVSGIAMGLILAKDKHVILSDIIGLEDFNGDMDFKVAGTEKGITALQMDVKVPGISFEILEEALKQAHEGRMFILEKMLAVQPQPNTSISKFAPKISIVQIDVEKIGDVIGPGGKMIKRIIAETGTSVNVEDDGVVTIAGTDQEAVEKAVNWVKGLTQDVKVGEEYDGKAVRIVPFGVFVNILPGKDGLVHISKLSTGYLASPTDVVNEGDTFRVRVNEVDEQGRVNLVPVTPFPAPAGSAPRSGGDSAMGPGRSSDFHRRVPFGMVQGKPFGGRSSGGDRREGRGPYRRDNDRGGREGGGSRKPYYNRDR